MLRRGTSVTSRDGGDDAQQLTGAHTPFDVRETATL